MKKAIYENKWLVTLAVVLLIVALLIFPALQAEAVVGRAMSDMSNIGTPHVEHTLR